MDQELLNEFILEAKANIDQMEELLLKPESLNNSKKIDELFRAAHSIKGTAGFFCLTKVMNLAHVMESILDELREGNLKINDVIVDGLIHAVDVMRRLLNDEEVEIESVIDDLKVILTTKTEVDNGKIGVAELQSAAMLWEQLMQEEQKEVKAAVEIPPLPVVDNNTHS